ncbi:winged helix DNA-binding domain-containing protein [Cellulomonas sp. URHD0024]|uniref:winged helix DNA-binding domain-containing protein n=1 Tax=Cellulomonas sp. URHD0024 TaxID=1302620 RepID=UPI000488A9E2|nr:winged helix DNA-binding domain-containing protein [Cellulomonas sp. URHD0024]
MTVLDTRALNRATLARQHLLDRADLPVLDAVSHLGGLQAQEPQEPFVGLWSRLRAFDPTALDGLLTERQVVRSHLMRCTVHLVTSDDMVAWRARHDAMLRSRMLAIYRAEVVGVDLDEFAGVAREFLSDGTPRAMSELAQVLVARWPAPRPRAHAELAIACLVPVAQTPPRGLWRAKAGVQIALLSTWLGRDIDPLSADDDEVGRAMVRRYLAAYGPAATADIRSWSGIAGLPAAVKAMRDELVSYTDERGRVLWDLPGAPLPDPDAPAPVRFLPAFDNALLGYDDRTRIVDDAHRGLSVAGTRVVLVDGRVSARWKVEAGTVSVTPLRTLTPAERSAVADEGAATASFLSDGASDRVVVGSTP